MTLAALAGVVELSAIGIYVNFWWPAVPGWISALLALAIIGGTNLLTVRAFGLIELGASAVKVLAIILFLLAGTIVVLLTSTRSMSGPASVANVWSEGGVFPNGIWAAVIVIQGVVFSFSAIEIVGISAGEAKDPQKTMPRAIRSVVLRIGLFYVGSVLMLAMLLPSTRYSGDESPFVTALKSFGVPGLGGLMNFVVLTAAISGVNATLYATVRLLRNLAANDSAPKVTAIMSRRGIPVGALLSVGAFYLLGVLLISFAGAAHAFEIVLGACAVFIIFGWIAIFVSHLGFRKAAREGRVQIPSFRMPGSPWTDYACLAALGLCFLSIVFDFSKPTWWYTLVAAIALPALHLLTYEYFSRRKGRDQLLRTRVTRKN